MGRTGSTSSPYSSGEYNARMRIQAFKENATGELFVLSMNHFKAKTSSDDGEKTRIQNASNLISKLKMVTSDPDIRAIVSGDEKIDVKDGETIATIKK